MPKMRNSNAPTVLGNHLHCDSKRNKPMLHHSICEAKCKKFKQCPAYSKWYLEYYGKELEKEVKPKRKKVVRRKKVSKKRKKK